LTLFLVNSFLLSDISNLLADAPPPGATAGAEDTRFRQQAMRDQQAKEIAQTPAEPKVEFSEDFGQAPFKIEPSIKTDEDLENVVGIKLLNQLDARKKAAAAQLKFEDAIIYRDKIREFKKAKEYQEIWDVQSEMQKAADSEDYEKAIALREELLKLQKIMETPAPEPKFFVRGIRLTGNSVLTTEQLEPFVQNVVNREVTLSEVKVAARDIKNYYRGLGYVAAYAYVPTQEVEGGMIEIRIIEGEIGDIEVTGAKYYSNELIRRKIKLEPGQIARYDRLKYSMRDINEHPDIKTKAILRPGVKPGTSDVLIKVEDRSPFHLSVDGNNYGTRLTGTQRAGITMSHNNVLGRFDQAIVRMSAGEDSYSVGANYNIPVNSYDTRLGFSFSHGDVDLAGDFKALNVEGTATTYSPYITHPIYKGEFFEATLRGGYDHKSVENRALDVTTGHDEIRMFNAGVSFKETDQYGQTFWPNFVYFAATEFGASNKNDEGLTRAHTGAPFQIYRTSVDRYQYLPLGMMLVLHGNLQMANDKLPPSEQFQLGGVNSVRGYPQGEFLGDYGATISTEFLVPPLFMPAHWKLTKDSAPLKDQIKFVAFFDYGTADLKGNVPGEVAKKDLAGWGVGMRFHVYDRMFGRIEYAMPLQEKTSDGTDGVFYYGFSMDLL